MSADAVKLETTDHVALLTLNRPGALNAFDGAMVRGIEATLAAVLGDESVGAVVITGAGKAFCAGADLKYLHACLAEGRLDDAALLVEAGGRIVQMIQGAAVPVVAAVHGVAAGGGCNLALACDVRFAGDSARFGQVFNRLGLVPDWGGTYLLPRLVGLARALELVWSAAWVEAPEAERIGLVNRVVPDTELLEVALRFGRTVAGKSRSAVAGAKGGLRAGHEGSLAEALAWEEAMQRKLFLSSECREALAAFVRPRT